MIVTKYNKVIITIYMWCQLSCNEPSIDFIYVYLSCNGDLQIIIGTYQYIYFKEHLSQI